MRARMHTYARGGEEGNPGTPRGVAGDPGDSWTPRDDLGNHYPREPLRAGSRTRTPRQKETIGEGRRGRGDRGLLERESAERERP